MKLKFCHHKIECPIYNKDIYIVMNPDEIALGKINEMRLEFDRNEIPLEIGECSGCFTTLSNQSYLLLFFGNPTLNTIAHECFHLTMYLFKEIGHEINDLPSQEAPAYFLGWLTEEVYLLTLAKPIKSSL